MRGRSQIPAPTTNRAALLAWTGRAYRWLEVLRDGLSLVSQADGTLRWTEAGGSSPVAGNLIDVSGSTVDVDLSEAPTVTPAAGADVVLVQGGGDGRAPFQTVRLATLQGRLGKVFELLEHFVVIPGTTTSLSGRLLVTASGAGAAVQGLATTEQDRPGIAQLTTGTTSTGRVAVHTFTNGIRLGGGPWAMGVGVRPTTLSDASQEYQIIVGFFDTAATLDQTDGVYLVYDRAGVGAGLSASVNWQCVTVTAGTRTVTDSGVAVVAASWGSGGDPEIRVNDGATEAEFVIGGAVVQTHTTNIPSSSTALVMFGGAVWKSAGTTARTVDLDYVAAAADLT